MHRRSFLVAAAAFAAAGAVAAPAFALDGGDRTIVPGIRVGAIQRSTPPADLAKIFGGDKVRYGKVHFAEGEEVPGATILAGTESALETGFTADGKRIEFVRILGKAWSTADGIRIGTPLAQLERINGGPFVLNGFGWDYGGAVRLNPRGKLPKGLAITLAPTKPVPERQGAQVSGDREVSSRHPVLAKMGVRVSLLTVAWPE
ncbi:MAG: hypothetical protein KIT16_12675 [Rhodospirillaceae bacterium]|nr:hypothetical protein [Rhodospirillaceae bacterium]